jgi:hypothetical protein
MNIDHNRTVFVLMFYPLGGIGMDNTYDVIVLGAGPGGTAAEKEDYNDQNTD